MVEQVVGLRFVVDGEQQATAALKRNTNAVQENVNAIKVATQQGNGQRTTLDRLTREVARAERELRRLAQAQNAGRISQGQFTGEMNRMATRLRNLGLENAQREVFRFGQESVKAAQSMKQMTSAAVQLDGAMDMLSVTQAGGATSARQQAYRMNEFGVVAQQAGYQVGDFLVQVQSGTNAFVAFGQQATQLVGVLPLLADRLGVSTGKMIAISSALGIAIPLFTAFAAAISRTGGASEIFTELAFAIEPIRPLLDAISSAMSITANAAIDFVNILVNNLDRIVVAATVVTGFFLTQWVSAFFIAGGAATALTGALTLLRAALIRLPFIAAIVAATELVYQFTKLVRGAGSFGDAIDLLGGVVSDFFDKTIRSGALLAEYLGDMWLPMEAGLKLALSNMLSAWGQFVGIVSSGMLKIPGLRETGMDLAFKAGMIGQSVDAMRNDAEQLSSSWSALSGSVASSASEIWKEPSAALEKLRGAMRAADEEGRSIDVRNWFGGAAATGSDEGGAGGAGGGAVTDALTAMQERIQGIADTIKSSMEDAFMSIVDGTKSAKDAFRSMAYEIIKELYRVLVVQQMVGSFNVTTGAGSGIVGFLGRMFTGGANANGNAFIGGNVTAFANGGVVGGPTMFPMSGGRTGLMGEAGPEAIMPLKRTSSGKLGVVAEGGGAVSVQNVINVQGDNAAAVRQEIAKLMPTITEATKSAVIDARRRGGQMRAAFS